MKEPTTVIDEGRHGDSNGATKENKRKEKLPTKKRLKKTQNENYEEEEEHLQKNSN
uniref:Uncharacterized protein n=1 Tax=Cucumis melo TaxID=3656 RepID=A0A9I9CJF4_CUCME